MKMKMKSVNENMIFYMINEKKIIHIFTITIYEHITNHVDGNEEN